MKSYKVYLTKSCEVSRQLAKSYNVDQPCVVEVKCGYVDSVNQYVPNIYKDCDLYYCAVTLEDSNNPCDYEIILA